MAEANTTLLEDYFSWGDQNKQKVLTDLGLRQSDLDLIAGFGAPGTIGNVAANAGKTGKALLQQYLTRLGTQGKKAAAATKKAAKAAKVTSKNPRADKLFSDLEKASNLSATGAPKFIPAGSTAAAGMEAKAIAAGLGLGGGAAALNWDFANNRSPADFSTRVDPIVEAINTPVADPYGGLNNDGFLTNAPIVPQHGGVPEGGTYGPFDDPTVQRVAPMSPQQRAQVIASIQPVAAPPRAPNAYDDRLNPFGIGSGYEELQRPRAVR